MNDTDLLELKEYLYPHIDNFTEEPYSSYLKYYKEAFPNFKFYLGFKLPDKIKRAQIYRSLYLICEKDNLLKNFIVHNTDDGMIIKSCLDSSDFIPEFDKYMIDGNNYVFIPNNCDKLDKYNYTYYRRILNNFISNEQIQGKLMRTDEGNSIFLFLLLEDSKYSPSELEIKWKQYLEGGVVRKCKITSDKLCSALKVFSWIYRISFKILPDDFIELIVKTPSLREFENKFQKINETSSVNFKFVDIDNIINNEYEAFGILRILQKKIKDVSKIIPLFGTCRIYYQDDINILEILNEYQEDPSAEGTEIFTQDEFSEMSKFRKASLIKAPSNNLYSFLDLYRNPKKIDPYTREEFSDEFIKEMKDVMNDINGIFMTGFPPIDFNPDLIMIESEPDKIIRTISFHIKIGEDVNPFWIIPDLRNTEYANVTIDAIRILSIKWSDNTLFKKSFPYNNVIPDGDIHLLFSPIALYVFEQTSNNLNLELYPKEIELQAQHLKDQCNLLRRCS
jgi:hypothetical protein